MKSSKPPEQIPSILMLLLLVVVLAPAPGKGQGSVVNGQVVPLPRQVPQKAPPPVVVKPTPRPVQPPVQPQVRRQAPPPQQRVQPRVNPATGKPAGGQVVQPASPTYAGRIRNTPGQNPVGGVRPATTLGGGSSQTGAFRMPPNARSVAAPGGGAMIVHPDGRRWLMDQNHHLQAFSRPGLVAKYNGDGRLNSVQVARPGKGNMAITRGTRGDRQTVAMRPGGVRVVTLGNGRGYEDRLIPGRPGYAQRTYVEGGQTYAHVYRANRYRGMVYFRYVPATTYQPRFYAWASSPWPHQAVYNWNQGQGQAPALGYYASYFTPAPSYPSASSWLTDYVMTDTLKSAYQNHQEYEQSTPGAPPAAEPDSSATPVSPEVKASINQEVQQQIADEQSTANQPSNQPAAGANQIPPAALDPHQRTFVVSQSLDLTQGGQTCTLTPGDVIYRAGDNLMPGGNVGVNVVASKAGDCPANTSSEINVNTLQDMQNQFREKIDAGLRTLASNLGKGGIPSGPAADPRPSPEGTAQPDAVAVANVEQDRRDADTAEGTAADATNSVG